MRPTPRAVLVFGVAFVVALLPAIVDGRLWTVWAGFSALAVLALAADLLLSVSPRRLAVSAEVPQTVHVGEVEPATVTLALAGRRVGDVDVPSLSGCQLLAVRRPRKGAFLPNPVASTAIEAGSTLIVCGSPEQVAALRTSAAG
jgi:K+/H+ antiporter YhaU regulatory subunit KhtT